MRRLPRVFAAVGLSSCSASISSDAGHDAGYDAGLVADSGSSDSGTAWGDAGCVLPSDFPFDSGFDMLPELACQCTVNPVIFHCFEENGPRCFSWACPPAKDRNDGGYEYMADGGIVCLC